MTRTRLSALATLALVALPAAASAQTVLVRVINSEGSQPMVGAIAYVVGADGSTVRNGLTDERGRALFVGLPPGEYLLRAEMIGMATAETALFAVAEGTTVTEELRLESSAIQLEGIEVELEAGRCSVRPGGEGLLVATVWDEARKALSAASLTDQRGSYRYETMSYDRQLDRSGVILDETQARRQGYMNTPFESRPAEDLAMNGFVQQDGRDYVYFAPDATVLLSDDFLDTHCFKMDDAGRNEEGFIGLGFEPTGETKSVPDIAGTMWLDPETAELRWLDFNYRFLDPEMTSPEVGGRVSFERMPDGTWIVPEWWIRMPVMSTQTDFEGRQRPFIYQYHQTGGMVLDVREAGGRSLGQRAETGGIEGVVRDSLGVPLRGVRVGVVGSNQEVFSNREGEFSITGLTPGRFQVRFVDLQLEQAGYIPEPVARDVIRGEMTEMEYHMPSIGDVLFEACRGVQREQGSVLLAGTVVDSRGRAVPEATVRVSWVGYTVMGGGGINPVDGDIAGLTEQTNGFETTASSTGFFRFCGVPANTAMQLRAAMGSRETDQYEVQIADYETGALRVLELPRN
ncbi:MAG: carboxypeptidase-like regulatory domain-containing protein [Gemmatimonadota bacterium]